MKKSKSHKNEVAITVRVVCTLLFLAFTFCWLYFFQADMLSVAQHGLSGGKTHYDRTIGAVIISSITFIIHLLTHTFTRIPERYHALSYGPSFLLLAFICTATHPFSWGCWLWMGPLLLVLWLCAIYAARKAPKMPTDGSALVVTARRLWPNLLIMVSMMLGIAAASNTNAVSHYKAHAEMSLMNGDPDAALMVGVRSLETDESLTMLRAFALSQRGLLGDSLFTYAVSGTSHDLLPMRESRSRLMLMPDTLLWQHFGVSPDSIVLRNDSALRVSVLTDTTEYRYNGISPFAKRMTVSQYLDTLETDTMATAAFRDYLLVGQLIDRRLDSFAETLPRYYAIVADSLPRHYREALVLYQQRVDTSYIYNDPEMLRHWHDFATYDSIYPKASERKIRTEEDFLGTYWYYYYR